MSKQLDLGAFLSDQTSEGKVDSHGEFTVSHTQAARKLAKFALPRNAAWVAKLVQAANRWNCSALQIRQSTTETLFHFTLPSLGQIPTEDAIVSCLLSGKVGGQSALDALCLALRSLVEQAQLSFVLVADDDDIEPRPIYAGHYYGGISEKERLDKRFNPKPGLSITVYHRPPRDDDDDVLQIVTRFRSYVPIIEELDRHCYTSPVPIFLDGRRVDGLVTSSSLGLNDIQRPLLFLGIKELRHSPERLPVPTDFEEKVVSLLSHPRRITRSYGGQKDFQAVFLVSVKTSVIRVEPRRSKRTARLLWVNDGVVVQDEALNIRTASLSLTIFANAAELSTDLTGFTLLNNDDFKARRREVLRQVGAELDSPRVKYQNAFRPDRDAETQADRDFDSQQFVRNRIKLLLKGSGTGIALTLFNPVLGVPTTLGAIMAAYTRKPTDPEERIMARRPALTEVIEADLKSLKEGLAAEGKVEQVDPMIPAEVPELPAERGQPGDLTS